MRKPEWKIRYGNREYRIVPIPPDGVLTIQLWYGVEYHNKSIKISKDRRLKRLVSMWYNTDFDMKPGEFITKVTGNKCDDLV